MTVAHSEVAAPARREPAGRRYAAAIRAAVVGIESGLIALAAAVLLLVASACRIAGARGPLATAFRSARAVAERDRRRLHRVDPAVLPPDSVPAPAGARLLLWVALRATAGLVVQLVVLLGLLYALEDLTFPLWWRLIAPPLTPTLPFPQNESLAAHDTASSLVAVPYGLLLALMTALAVPLVALVETRTARALLNPPPGTDLRLRVAELTATRAAALDAHAAELRRIERALHDGAQSRLVAVSVLVGAARRAVERGDLDAGTQLERAQLAAEDALAELRSVARAVLPPVLESRGLTAALQALAERCAVPCSLTAGPIGRCLASIEATVYYVVAEALANVNRHSRASSAAVALTREGDVLHLLVEDDGVGGAGVQPGTGLAGMRDRVAAHDGTLEVRSPAGGPTRIEAVLPCGS